MPFELAEPFILAAEQQLGSKLPEAYRSAMLRENGGEFETEEDTWQQYPIADTSDRKRLSRTANHIIKETESCNNHFLLLTPHSDTMSILPVAG